MTDTHSPLPWFVADWDNDGGDNLVTIEYRYPAPDDRVWPDGVGHGFVATTEDSDNPIADAAYIAEAANEYPALKARLAKAERLLRELYVLCRGHQELLGCDQLGGRAYSAAREFLSDGSVGEGGA